MWFKHSSPCSYHPKASWWIYSTVSGYTTFDATLQDVCAPIKAIVVSNLHKNLLISWQDLIALRVIKKNFPSFGKTKVMVFL